MIALANEFHFPDGGALVMVSPPLSGAKDLVFSYVAGALAKGQGVVFVTTDESPEDLKKQLVGRKIFFGDNVKFMDCYTSLAEEAPPAPGVKRLSGPLALNEISVALSEAQRGFLAQEKKHALVFKSLSTLLMYSSADAVGRFVQVIVAKVKKGGGSALFTLEEGMHDEKTVVVLEHLMDGIIEARKEKDALVVKARGFPGYEDWTRL
ncbi:MAG: RAD55 family ATPase [Candidatus Micrarchaeota archaeon]|nr:RAD55 family ATPase [Candidatus Micrarchaeota archaeon]